MSEITQWTLVPTDLNIVKERSNKNITPIVIRNLARLFNTIDGVHLVGGKVHRGSTTTAIINVLYSSVRDVNRLEMILRATMVDPSIIANNIGVGYTTEMYSPTWMNRQYLRTSIHVKVHRSASDTLAASVDHVESIIGQLLSH